MQDKNGLGAPLLTMRQAADHLGISEKSLSRYVKKSQIKSLRIGWRIKFDPAEVAKFIAQRMEGA